jgi:hypothetical protein
MLINSLTGSAAAGEQEAQRQKRLVIEPVFFGALKLVCSPLLTWRER